MIIKINYSGIKKSSVLCYIILAYLSLQPGLIYSQQIHTSKSDTLKNKNKVEIDDSYLDSLKPVISDIIFTGNDITDNGIILREMRLQKGQVYSSKLRDDDQRSIHNLGLFADEDITPEQVADNKVALHVNVKEKWYIYPIPQASISDGDIRKLTVGMNLRWQNFRGQDENIGLSFGIGYNPFVRASYTIPWIGKDLHMFTTISGGFQKEANRSLLALGRSTGEQIVYARDTNFDYMNYSAKLTVGKYFAKKFSIYAEGGYSFLRVSEFADNRTLSPNGVDKYILLGLGLSYDSRDSRDYSVEGYLVHASYEHYGLLSNTVNFGRFNLEARNYLPVKLADNYAVTFATRFYTSVAIGSLIPYYNHMYLGYGNDFVRGWARYGFEGDNDMTLYNEVRVPIIQPNQIKGDQIPIIRSLPYIKKFAYKYGLYFTMFYDVGTIWNEDDRIKSIHFLTGTGIGLNAILPFGLVGKVEWAFRLGKPVVGQAIFGLGAKF